MNTSQTEIDVTCTVNGRSVTVRTKGGDRLIDMLRDYLHLTGTKEGCSIGECGACTVLMDGLPVNSCMVLAGQAQGKEILTIEGLKHEDGDLHPLQQAFIDAGAIQCGYCTPAMILCGYALLQRSPRPSVHEIKQAISGTLCRCTGYVQIIEAVTLAADRIQTKGEK